MESVKHKPRIWQVTSSRAWGGRESLPVHLHEEFLTHGYESRLFCSIQSAIASRHGNDTGVDRLPFSNQLGGSTLRILRHHLKDAAPDALICHYSHDLFLLRRLLGRSKSTKLILVKHVGPGKRKGDVIHRWIYAGVDRVVGVSHYIARRCGEAYPIDSSRVGVWHPGIDHARFAPDPESRKNLRQQLSLRDDDFLIVYIARLTPGKGHEDLIKAFHTIGKESQTANLALIGSASPDEQPFADSLQHLVASGPFPGRVLLPGFQENIPQWLSAADIFVNPSPKEAFGLNTLEAMSAGVPIIGTTGGGTPDLVESGETGILVPPGNGHELSAAIGTLLSDADLRDRYGAAANRRALLHFSLTDAATRLLETAGVATP